MHERLKMLRKSLRLSQAEFGARIKTAQSTYSRWESGANSPADANIALICQTFGVSETWLRSGEGDMFPPANTDEELAAWLGSIVGGHATAEEYILVDTIRRLPQEARHDFIVALRAAMDEYEKKNSSAE